MSWPPQRAGETPPPPAPPASRLLLTDEAAMHAIATVEQHARTTAELIAELHEWMQLQNTPAAYDVVDLNSVTPVKTIDTRGRVPSLGIINPTGVNLYLGVGGGRASASGRGFPVPSNSGVVLPVSVEDPDVGIDPADVGALGGNTAVFFVLKFKTVQLFHLWRF